MTKDQAVPGAAATPVTGLRRGAFLGYRWALLAFLLAGVAQIFLAGLGVFRLQGEGLAAGGDTAFAPHRALGFTMAGIALLILVLALIARPGARDDHPVRRAGPADLTDAEPARRAGGQPRGLRRRCTPSTGCSILGIAGYLYVRSRRRET